DRKEEERTEFVPSLDLLTVEAMKGEWLRQIRARASEISTMSSEPDLMSLLYRWRQYGSEDEPRRWIAEAMKTDYGFAALVNRMMSRGTSSSWGDRVSTPHYTFQRETIEDFIGIEIAKTKCDTIDPSAFPEHETASRTLMRHLDLWLGYRERDAFDF
ncbi:hypothetical protein OY671_008664, partial [Metschnikowia pulcherrima]